LRLSPSREEQTEDRDEEQDGGHAPRSALPSRRYIPWQRDR
jgi:hypothetical protein